jgi:hypothetical protein
MKLRRILLAVVAALAFGTALAPSAASARGWGRGGWGRGGWGWGPGIGIGLGLGLGLAAGAYGPYYGSYYGGGPYYGYGGCWRRVVVGTPYGPRYRRVWVC